MPGVPPGQLQRPLRRPAKRRRLCRRYCPTEPFTKRKPSTGFHYLKEQVKQHSNNLAYEKAAYYQSKINDLKNYQSSSTVVNTRTGTVDVFSIMEEENTVFINYLAVNNGTIIQTKTITLQKKLEETPQEILPLAIASLRKTFESEAKELILPFNLAYPEEGIKITTPKAGNKKSCLIYL